MKYKTVVLKYNPRAKKNGGRSGKNRKRICQRRLEFAYVFRYSFGKSHTRIRKARCPAIKIARRRFYGQRKTDDWRLYPKNARK